MRPCGVCNHPDRSQLEERILSSEPIAFVAVDAGLSVSAVNRHRRNHLRAELRAELATRAASAHVSDFADQLVELADDANTVRDFARASNNPDLLLRAAASKRETLTTLTHRLGIESDDTVESLREAKAAMRAVASVLPRHPEALAELLAYLREHGQTDLARALASSVGRVRPLPAAQTNRTAKETS